MVAEDKKHPKRNIVIVMLSNYLCLRSIELAAIKISDVLEQNTIQKVLRLVAAYTKADKDRDVTGKQICYQGTTLPDGKKS